MRVIAIVLYLFKLLLLTYLGYHSLTIYFVSVSVVVSAAAAAAFTLFETLARRTEHT